MLNLVLFDLQQSSNLALIDLQPQLTLVLFNLFDLNLFVLEPVDFVLFNL